MSPVRLTALAESLPSTVPFIGPEAQERSLGRPFVARLGANENGFGPSPKAVAAMAEAAPLAWRYGDPEGHVLKEVLAEKTGLSPEHIVLGEGIDGLLGLLVRLLVERGDAVVTSDGAYPTFNYHAVGYGGRLVKVPYRDDREDLDGLLQAVRREEAKLVYVSNPDNPMGTWHEGSALAAFAAELPEDCVLCLDEAYAEFASASAVLPLDRVRPNVVRMRTFSKAYGLAGLRIGYAFAEPALAKAFDKVRNHFGIGGLAQAAAVAALNDDAHLDRTIRAVEAARRRIMEIGCAHGLEAIESAANFQTLDTGRDGAFARRLVSELGEAGVFVRMPFVAPGDRCIRVSCGPNDQLAAFEAALGPALARAAA